MRCLKEGQLELLLSPGGLEKLIVLPSREMLTLMQRAVKVQEKECSHLEIIVIGLEVWLKR
jgi:hypothetical protein